VIPFRESERGLLGKRAHLKLSIHGCQQLLRFIHQGPLAEAESPVRAHGCSRVDGLEFLRFDRWTITSHNHGSRQFSFEKYFIYHQMT